MERYIGLDVHARSSTAAIVDAQGKRIGSHVLETNGQCLVEFVRCQAGRVHLCLEEGTQAGWLHEILSPHAHQVVVIQAPGSRGQKRDELDAFGLAEMLRRGAVDRRVWKPTTQYAELRLLVKAHYAAVQDTSRAMNRIKALYRSRGVAVAGTGVYREEERADWLKQLPSTSRQAATLLYSQYDLLREVRNQAQKALVSESHRHSITRLLETCPGLGVVRVARIVAIVVTPERFRTRAQFWGYCGLAIVTRSSSDWLQGPDGRWLPAEVKQTRGLNRNRNGMLKDAFKGAAKTAISLPTPFRQAYERLIAAGTKPNLAKLTIARKLASTTLAMWKNKEEYDPKRAVKTSK